MSAMSSVIVRAFREARRFNRERRVRIGTECERCCEGVVAERFRPVSAFGDVRGSSPHRRRAGVACLLPPSHTRRALVTAVARSSRVCYRRRTRVARSSRARPRRRTRVTRSLHTRPGSGRATVFQGYTNAASTTAFCSTTCSFLSPVAVDALGRSGLGQ